MANSTAVISSSLAAAALRSATTLLTGFVVAASSDALATWKRKLDYFREQEAIESDAAAKFKLTMQIEEAERTIRELGGNPPSPQAALEDGGSETAALNQTEPGTLLGFLSSGSIGRGSLASLPIVKRILAKPPENDLALADGWRNLSALIFPGRGLWVASAAPGLGISMQTVEAVS